MVKIDVKIKGDKYLKTDGVFVHQEIVMHFLTHNSVRVAKDEQFSTISCK
jgi:hypothetical protein